MKNNIRSNPGKRKKPLRKDAAVETAKRLNIDVDHSLWDRVEKLRAPYSTNRQIINQALSLWCDVEEGTK